MSDEYGFYECPHCTRILKVPEKRKKDLLTCDGGCYRTFSFVGWKKLENRRDSSDDTT